MTTASSYSSNAGISLAGSVPTRSINLLAYSRAELNFWSPSQSTQMGLVAPITRGIHAREEGWYGRASAQYGAVTPGPEAIATRNMSWAGRGISHETLRRNGSLARD